MMQDRPVVTFDTSVHNRLMKDGLESEAIYAALHSGYFVRLAGLSIEELIATSDGDKRSALIASAGRLQNGPHDFLLPQNEILRLLISAHEASPSAFRWGSVNVSAPEYAMEITKREFISDDDLVRDQREHFASSKKEFESVWSALRPKLEVIFQRDDAPRPRSIQEVLPHATVHGGVFWGMAKGLYEKGANAAATDEKVRHFVETCPPFRCCVYAMLMAWYDRSMRDWNSGEKFHAGRVDLFMAVYLPYCNQFLSAEQDGEQERCLAEVARLAGVQTIVCSYDNFCAGLMIPASVG